MTSSSHSIDLAQLVIWNKKFAPPLARIRGTTLQKIYATDHTELVLSVYKPGDDKSVVVFRLGKKDCGVELLYERPQPLPKPNSFVQIARKYLLNRKIKNTYATFSPIGMVLELDLNPHVRDEEIEQGPNCLILDLDSKPARVILARKTIEVPKRYQAECGSFFSYGDEFFESWCEWSEESTKTKRRASFLSPSIGYCPLLPETAKETQSNETEIIPPTPWKKNLSPENITDVNSALPFLPTHVRRHARTRLQFLERRLQRQKYDFPSENELNRLKTQSENLKSILYLWPENSLTWYVPPQFIEEFKLNPMYTIKKGEKPSVILVDIFRKIEILERRKVELTKRILESEKSLRHFQNLVMETGKGNFPLEALCKVLDIEVTESQQSQKLKKQKEGRLPYRQYTASTGAFIRVARSAADGDLMIKKMPSHHYWLHVLTGEGSHVWVEKLKGEKKIPPQVLREGAILAVHHSKHARSQEAEVQIATRADIEKKKNLPPGKVLVRRCETLVVRYEQEELRKVLGVGENANVHP